MIKLTFLGTGTSSGIPMLGCKCSVCTSKDPKDTRQRCAVILSTNKHNLLIDAGPDIKNQLITHNITHIDALFITHSHYDHMIGIDELRPLSFDKAIPLFSDKHTLLQIKHIFDYLFKQPLQKGGGLTQLTINEVEAYQEYKLFGHSIVPVSILHGQMPIIGFKIDNLAYLTDVKTLPNQTIETIKNIDTLIISCLRKNLHETHINIEEMIEFVHKINPRICYTIHMNHELSHQEWSNLLPKNIIPAYDGLEINI